MIALGVYLKDLKMKIIFTVGWVITMITAMLS